MRRLVIHIRAGILALKTRAQALASRVGLSGMGWLTRGQAVGAMAMVAVSGMAMTTGSSTSRPATGLEMDDRVRAVLEVTGGQMGPEALAALRARLSPAELSLLSRHDPAIRRTALYGLTPGWESLTLAGKPVLDPGADGIAALRANADVPAARGMLRPALPFDLERLAPGMDRADRDRALRCLTQAIYYEAALEPRIGQEGVAQVVLNRVRDPNFPNTVCGVVFQGAERVTGCQFSFTCDGSLSRPPVDWAWKQAQAVARRALAGHVAERVGTATHYHADYVRPWWAPSLAKLDQIGAHIFYRWKGYAGETASFSQVYAGREPVIDEARFSRPRAVPATIPAADGQAELLAAAPPRTVEIDGQTRVVGVASLGGRRQPTREEVAEINRNLAAYERGDAPAPVTTRRREAAPGVVDMEVEEVGRPGG